MSNKKLTHIKTTMAFLYGPDASPSPEHSERIPGFISSSFRHLQLMEGAVDFKHPAPIHASHGVAISRLPEAGNCAMGGCGDPMYSPYAADCPPSKCGTAGTPVAAEPIDSQRAFSSSDCTNPNVACKSWLDLHNCHPAFRTPAKEALCPNLQ